MLRGQLVGDLDGDGHASLARMILPFSSIDVRAISCRRQAAQLALDLGLDALCQGRAVRHQDGGGHFVVLSLAEQVRRDPGRVRRAVGDDEDLAGPGDHVDIDKAEDLPLGFRDKGIAGANDLIDLRDRLRAISQGSDGLGAAGLEDPIHPGDLRRRQNDRRDTAAAGGGRDHDDLACSLPI